MNNDLKVTTLYGVKKNNYAAFGLSIIIVVWVAFNFLIKDISLMVLLVFDILLYGLLFLQILHNIFKTIKMNLFVLNILIILLFLFISVSTNFERMYKGLFVYFVSSFSVILFYAINKRKLIKHTDFILIGFYIIVVLLSVLPLIFERQFSDRNNIQVLPNLAVNANGLAYPIMLGLVLGVYYILKTKPLKKLLFFIISLVPISITFLLLQSRGAYVGMGGATFILILTSLFSKKKEERIKAKFGLAILIAFCLIVLLVTFLRTKENGIPIFSDNGRFKLWEIAFRKWQENIFFGGGNAIDYNGFMSSHNYFLDLLSQYGMFVFLSVVVLLFQIAFHMKDKASYAFILMGLIQSFVDTLNYSFIFIALFIGLLINDYNLEVAKNDTQSNSLRMDGRQRIAASNKRLY